MPTIKMRQRRFLTHPAAIEGGYVVLYYNPRPEEDAEIQVRTNQPRMVWTGYSFTIPDGYVADLWSAGRCVASFAGSNGNAATTRRRGDYDRPSFADLEKRSLFPVDSFAEAAILGSTKGKRKWLHFLLSTCRAL